MSRPLRRYQNRAIEAAQVIEELIQLAKEMREANARGEQLGLSDDELAFYDALETNDSAVQVLGDETLRAIARELVDTVRNNVTIDWNAAGERPGQAPGDGQAHPAQTRLPARQAGEGNRPPFLSRQKCSRKAGLSHEMLGVASNAARHYNLTSQRKVRNSVRAGPPTCTVDQNRLRTLARGPMTPSTMIAHGKSEPMVAG